MAESVITLKTIIIIVAKTSLLIIFLISCSNVTDPEATSRIKINFLLDDIEDAVCSYNLNDIIDRLHTDFYHNGRDREEQSFVWQKRLLKYFSLEIAEREIIIYDYMATVNFNMILRNNEDTIYSEEPSEEYGDISYLLKEDGIWYLYGNQHETRQD